MEDLTRDELIALLSQSDPDALSRARSNKLSTFKADLDVIEGDYEELSDAAFQAICDDREMFSKLSHVEKETVQRWADIEALRQHYVVFGDFLYDCMTELMGFNCTEIQLDIAAFIADKSNSNIMVQAQRSQAKSTIVAIYAVWMLIHDCKHRVLIISAGSDVATEIANWVIQIIMNWDILECMRPDRQHGDRASCKAFDIHWQLKGAEKSPSIACIGITSNMQGRRADLLIPDDIESSKNGTTEIQRATLTLLSKDFTSICAKGRIVYLGTPQTTTSIYNDLPTRGFLVRVWPGRYPTKEELRFYGDQLAPLLQYRIDADPSLQKGGGIDGSRGKPTDPQLLGEQVLCKKELDQGPAYFNLQHMLNTELSDELKHPLKTRNLVVMSFDIDKTAGEITWLPSPERQIQVSGYTCRPQFYRPFTTSTQVYAYEGKHMYVDTAGGGKNGDETVAAVTYFLHGYIFLAEILKLPGGYSDQGYIALSNLALKHGVNDISVEKNFGFGAFASAWRPILAKVYKDKGKPHCPVIEDVWESGQKELRIIDTLEPIMARHRLIVHTDIIEYDLDSVKKYPLAEQECYKFFHQLSKISRDKQALLHDDSVDAVAGSVRKWVEMLAVDETIRMEQKVTDENVDFFKQWGANIGKQQDLGRSTDRFNRVTNRRRQ